MNFVPNSLFEGLHQGRAQILGNNYTVSLGNERSTDKSIDFVPISTCFYTQSKKNPLYQRHILLNINSVWRAGCKGIQPIYVHVLYYKVCTQIGRTPFVLALNTKLIWAKYTWKNKKL